MSCRILLSPFPTLQHHLQTSLFGSSLLPHSIMFSIHSIHSTVTIPSFTTISSNTISLCYSPFLPILCLCLFVLHFSPHPIFLRSSPFLSTLCFYPFVLRFCPSSQLDAFSYQLLFADWLRLATSPYNPVPFPYKNPYTTVARPQFVID